MSPSLPFLLPSQPTLISGHLVSYLIILIHYRLLHRLVKHVNMSGREFARANLPLEEHIQLGKGPSVGLWQTKVGVNDTQKANAALHKYRARLANEP